MTAAILARTGRAEGDNARPGGSHGTWERTPPGDGTNGGRRGWGGRRRRPRSMGRYPFVAAANAYLDILRPHRAPVTWEQLRRDLRTIDADLRELRASRRISTANPASMTVDDLAAVVGFWRTRPRRGKHATGTLDPTSQRHLYGALKGLLAFHGNAAVWRLEHEVL